MAEPPVVDLSAAEPGAASEPLKRIPQVERARERTRAVIALVLVGLLSVVILAALAAVEFASRNVDDTKSLLEVVLPPIVALTGTALGFYFGGISEENRSS